MSTTMTPPMSQSMSQPTWQPRPTVGPGATVPSAVRIAGEGPRYRLTRRGRIVVVLLGALFVVACGIAHATGSAASGDARHETRVVVVQPGESLWTLASDASGGRDVNAMIDRIEAVNHLDGVDVQAGLRLRVPTQG